MRGNKNAGSRLFSSQLICTPHLLITDGGNDDGGGSSIDARRTHRAKAHNSSHSTDTVGNSNTGMDNSTQGNTPEIQTLFQPRRQRLNAVPERKPIPLLPIRLGEVVSSSLFISLYD
jgi:hypothetical protein